MIHIHHLKFVLYWFTWIVECSADCPFKECYCYASRIECMDGQLSQLKPLTNKNNSGFSTLYISSDNITNIPSGSLPPSLAELSLLGSPLATIDNAAFDESANTLGILQLSGAQFSRLPDAFSRLKVLKTLSIYQSTIQDWNINAMRNIGQTLDTLFLSDVGLKSWPDWIRYCTKLTRLSVLDSNITFIPDGAMNALANTLVHLFLYNNSLTVVPRAISNFTALQELDLKVNKISDVSWLPRLSKLQVLSLNTNNISEANSLSNALRPYTDSLSSLDIQVNSLTAIPTLDYLTKIQYLDLTNNKISDSNSGSLPFTLTSVNLNYNLLQRIPRFVSHLKSVMMLTLQYNAVVNIFDIDFPPAIELVELEFNLITELTDSSFPQNSSIQFLYLDNNPIVRISSLAFRNLPLLLDLSLGSTKLTRLPLGLTFLKRLTDFKMSDNAYLVCTCQERSLEPWILSLGEPNVKDDNEKINPKNGILLLLAFFGVI